MSTNPNFERVTATAAPLLSASPEASIAAAVVRPDGTVAVDPEVYSDHGTACLAYVRLAWIGGPGCQFIDGAPQRFTVTERPDLGERTYRVTCGKDEATITLPEAVIA